uniref:ZP domain-containing protein n=1 Tax=Plectus sambesii TaxID=2011161 RepID=A0A914WQW8_9BILA
MFAAGVVALTVVGLLAVLVIGQRVQPPSRPGLSDRVLHKEHEIPEEEIIELPVGRFPEPTCDYSVHWQGPDGPPVTGTVQVGDPLYHSWKCYHPDLKFSAYCMMVHNCTVSSDGGATVVPIIDEFGCTLFPYILPHVSYEGDLVGGLRANAFSLDIDQPAVSFGCSIRLLVKTNGLCRRPKCMPLEWFQRRPRFSSRRVLK